MSSPSPARPIPALPHPLRVTFLSAPPPPPPPPDAPENKGSAAAFAANLKDILAHNADATQTWKKGVNKFSGMTRAEFKASLSGYKARHGGAAQARAGALPAPLAGHQPVSALPASLDWREKGVVTPVKDQGQCGGCWSFSAAETAESIVAIATGKLLVLSEQQILSCTPNPEQCGGTGGCSGATQELACAWQRAARARAAAPRAPLRLHY